MFTQQYQHGDFKKMFRYNCHHPIHERAAKRIPPVTELASAVETIPAQQPRANRLAQRIKDLFGDDEDLLSAPAAKQKKKP